MCACVCVHVHACVHLLHNYAQILVDTYILGVGGGITFSISMYIMCVCLFSALSRRVGALQIILLLCEPSAVTSTLETVTEYFCTTLWFMMMHQHTMFGYKRSSGSDEIIDKTQTHKNKARWTQGFQYSSLLPLSPNNGISWTLSQTLLLLF